MSEPMVTNWCAGCQERQTEIEAIHAQVKKIVDEREAALDEIERLQEQIEIRSVENSDLVKQAIRNNAEIERLKGLIYEYFFGDPKESNLREEAYLIKAEREGR